MSCCSDFDLQKDRSWDSLGRLSPFLRAQDRLGRVFGLAK